MRSNSMFKFWMDILMIIMILLALANELIDNMVHEVMGLVICLIIIIHNIINIKWYKNIFKGFYDGRRIFNMFINTLLLVSIIVLFVTSIITSEKLFVFLDIKSSKGMQQAHIASAYWFVLFMGLHLGTHFLKLLRVIKKNSFNITTIDFYYFKWGFYLLIMLFGIYASFERNIWNKLFMKSAFDYWNFEEDVVGFFIYSFCIILMYAVISYGLQNQLKRHKKINKLNKLN